MFGRTKIAMLVAEFLGTAILTMAAITMVHATAISYFVATSVAITFVLLQTALAPSSGGFFNPAVTLGFWTARKIQTFQAIAYIAVQFLGALVGWQLFEYLSGRALPSHGGAYDSKVLVAELIGTFIFTIGITAAVTHGMEVLSRAATMATALFSGIIIASVASQGILNPAIAMGLRYWDASYVFGPILGAILGVNLYVWVFAPADARPKFSRPARVKNNSSSAKKRG